MSLTVYVDGQYKQFSSINNDLGAALTRGQPIKPDGSAYTVTSFLGGFLLDGCPLNVILGQGWLPGQIDALKGGGILPTCLIPGTYDYVAFYGNTGIPTVTVPPATTVPPPSQPTLVQPGAVPPTIQVTEQPYQPPLSTEPEPPSLMSAISNMDTTTLLILGVVAYFLFFKKR